MGLVTSELAALGPKNHEETDMNGKGYKAILILVVGLTAFSSAIKELNQIREFGADASAFVS